MSEVENAFYFGLSFQEEYLGTKKRINEIVPLLSVVVNTYQHVQYIQQCLDSILSQEVDFEYELIIGEDGSTDGTREICIKYAEQYTNKIRLFLRDRKYSHYYGSNGNDIMFNGSYSRIAARGDYVALCEGDDYWIDKKKVKKQINVFQNNRELAICFTEFATTAKRKNIKKFRYDSYSITDLLKNNIPATLTVMYNRKYYPKILLPDPLMSLWFGDWSLWVLLSEKGKLHCIHEITAIYRIHNNGKTQRTSYKKKYLNYQIPFIFIKPRAAQ